MLEWMRLRKFLLLLFFIFLILASVSIYFFYKTQQNVNEPTSGEKTMVGNVEFEIVSEIPKLKIKSLDNEQLERYMTQMSLWPLENVPVLGAARTITPAKIEIVLKPQENFLADTSLDQSLRTKRIYEEVDPNGKPLTSYLQGELSVDEKILTLTIYTDPDFSKRTIYSPEKFLTRNILFEIFLNLQPTPDPQGINQKFQEAIPAIDFSLFEIEQLSRTTVDKFLSLIVKEVNAQTGQCQGTITCGTSVSQGTCSGDPSITCTRNSDCLGVGTCQITSGCRYDSGYGSSGNCLLLGAGPSCTTSCGSGCTQGTCTFNPGAATCTPNGYKPSEFGGAGCCSGCSDPVTKICQACPIAPPPPPSCGNGTCGGSETCISCPQDCGACPAPPPGTCSVCFSNIANCGAVGRSEANGTCSNPADRCCGPIGGGWVPPGPCTVFVSGPSTLGVGQEIRATLSMAGIGGAANARISWAVSGGARLRKYAGSPLTTSVAYTFGFPNNFLNSPSQASPIVVGTGPNNAVITVDGEQNYDSGPQSYRNCNGNSIGIVIRQVGPWWQVRDADIYTGGNLISAIPTASTAFDLKGTGGYPGVPVYASLTPPNFGSGVSAETELWIANSSYQGRTYDYAYFVKQIPPNVTLNSINNNRLSTGNLKQGTATNGYIWYKTTGDTLVQGNIQIQASDKIILLVENGNLNVSGRIDIETPGSGFFMALVNGDIVVDPSVSPQTPDLEGFFLADGKVRTGTAGSNDQQLTIRGAVVAYEEVDLQRNLGNLNGSTPAELIEYDPALLMAFPKELLRDRIVWQEVAP